MSTHVPPVTILTTHFSCFEPIQRIHTADDIAAWLSSTAYSRLMTMVVQLNAAALGKKRCEGRPSSSATIAAVLRMLDDLENWIEEIPLRTGPQRFGNAAFRDWGARLVERSRTLHDPWLPQSHKDILVELLAYFNNSFGNWIRIDYGSGHELAFLAYLTVLRYAGLLSESDEDAMVFEVFERYLRVCRALQAKYRLEPAGSKGVWGLEDHQFLNFLWGSSQLIDSRRLRPPDILQSSIVDENAPDYLFFSSVQHINRLKRGPFNEHSPILYNIAMTVPDWKKVNSGLVKMYKAEVLEKQPVVQHFLFGSILSWTDAQNGHHLITTQSAVDPAGPANQFGHSGTDLPSSTTRAPWADNPMAADQTPTSAPWAMSAVPPASVALHSAPSGSSGASVRTSQTGRLSARAISSLASTGSAAAISSPMGAISRPMGSHSPDATNLRTVRERE